MRTNKVMIPLFLLPACMIYLAIFLYPTLRTVIMSFYNVSTLSSKIAEWRFVGLENYRDLIHNSYFIGSVWNVLGIWTIGGALIFILAFLYAVILNTGVRWKGFWRSLIFLPNTVSAVVLSVVWLQYIFSSADYGFLTSLFNHLGLTSLAKINWTSDQHLYMSMILAFSFGSVGYYMLILMAGMDRIPHDYYEVALLDGANPADQFFKITLPLLRDVFRMTLVLWTITAMNFFVWSATFGLDSPKTVTPAFYMYQKVFGTGTNVYKNEVFNVGTGASVGVLITLAILVLSAVINRFFQNDRLEY